jgi:molybdenum cofactor synthesis domain-containing protein
MRVAIITISDSVSQGIRTDASGPALRDRCLQLGWDVVSEAVLPDDPDTIRERLVSLADNGAADLILTTGGTGIGPRDLTPEATAQACQKLLPGIPEVMREYGRRKNPRAALSRALAGVRGHTLIVNVPGSPRGAVESLDAVAELLPHALAVLGGARHDQSFLGLP